MRWNTRAVWLSGVAAIAACCTPALAEPHPILAIGSPAPDFALPGVDGQIHRLSDYAASRALVVVFTCNHCPIAQMYESRTQQLSDDYSGKGVAVVAIEGNDPDAIRVDELDSSDLSDTLPEMKIRAAYHHLRYPYLYDGETQSVTRAYGPQATPHVFVFDKERRLRYEGRFDNSFRHELVTKHDARDALDAVLAERPVEVTHTPVFGCSTKWKEKEAGRIEALRKIESQPVTLELASAEDLKKRRSNPTDKFLLLSFRSIHGPGVQELADLETTYRMYGVRGLEYVAVFTDGPRDRAAVLSMLQEQHATSRNLLFGSDDASGLRKAFDPEWKSDTPVTALIAPGGRLLYRQLGPVDILQLRRTALAAMPSDYIGFNEYWMASSAGKEKP